VTKDGRPWECPFCKRPVIVTESSQDSAQVRLWTWNRDEGDHYLLITWTTCPSKDCGKTTLAAGLYPSNKRSTGGTEIDLGKGARQTWSLLPESSAKIFPDYVPQQIRDDYTEARKIQRSSPKASATLARRCLQGMIRDFWEIKKKNLAAAISALKGKVEPRAYAAIDGIRRIGNIGAHMEKDVNLIIDVEPGEAEKLLQLVEALITDWYIKRHERDELYGAVEQISAEKQAARKRAPAPVPPASPSTAAASSPAGGDGTGPAAKR
jgi:hypothetical protein